MVDEKTGRLKTKEEEIIEKKQGHKVTSTQYSQARGRNALSVSLALPLETTLDSEDG